MEELDQDNEEELKQLLLGKRVKKISDDTLLLDDYTTLKIIPNEGCGGCPSGFYQLDYLNECPDNAIMDVKILHMEENIGYEPDRIYSIFVLAADSKLMKLAEISGNDGNGYYGTGFRIHVQAPDVSQLPKAF